MGRWMPVCALMVVATSASAQVPGLGALGGGTSGMSGGLGGLLAGAAVPNLSSVGAANATGVLGYCVKRKLLSATSAQSVLGKLTGQPGIAGSNGFAAGQNGQIVTKNGQVSLDGMKDSIKGKVCSMVLDHAQTFVGH